MITLNTKEMDDICREVASLKSHIESCRKLIGAEKDESLHDAIKSVTDNVMKERSAARKVYCSLSEMVKMFDGRTFNPSYALDELARAHEALKIYKELKS